jgi:hypothetical protein
MLFVFEDLEHSTNFLACGDVNRSGIRRFGPCPITTTMDRTRHQKYENVSFANIEKTAFTQSSTNYVYSTGVNHSPQDWCGGNDFSAGKSLFEHLPPKVLADLKSKTAILLIDQSHEGYQTSWLWKWFHSEMHKFEIPPQQVIYVTGNLKSNDQYDYFCRTQNIVNKIFVVPYVHFEHMIYETMENRYRIHGGPKTPSFLDHMSHKTNNLSSIKTYNLLQKRLRAHRMWAYKYFHDGDIVDDGLISMNPLEPRRTVFENKEMTLEEINLLNSELPKVLYNKPNNVGSDLDYIVRFNDQTVLDSWISVVSEASFGDGEHTCFLSEKTFKSIACNHPFIVLGNRGSLSYLREMGYKTFSKFFDESYDELPTWERMTAIVSTLKQINQIEDKLSWFESMQETIEHNYNTLIKNSKQNAPTAQVQVLKYCEKIFNV